VSWIFTSALGLFILWQATENFQRIYCERPEAPSFNYALRIDSDTFVYSGNKMKQAGSWWFPPEYQHSVGMQVVMGWWFMAGGTNNFLPLKLIYLAIWFAALALVGVAAGRATGNPAVGMLAAGLLSFSHLFSVYTATVQHEIILGFFGAALVALSAKAPSRRSALMVGMILAIAACFRINYLVAAVVVGLGYATDRRGREAGWSAYYLVGFFAVALPWNIAHSLHRGLFYFYDSYIFLVFRQHMNPNARAYNFPYTLPAEPHGFAFAIQYPGLYSRLLFERVGLLFGVSPDVWFVESNWSQLLAFGLRLPVAAVREVTLLVGGLLFACGISRVNGRSRIIPMAILLAVVTPHFLVGASSRFLVPALPVIAFFQAWGLYALYLGLRNFCEELSRSIVRTRSSSGF
jgi:uncharacterized membrane protein